MMSHRGKRQALSRLDDITAVATKRRKGRAPPPAEEEEASPVDQRQSYSSIASDMKISSIYNRSVTDAPAELFRKDLISAMKLPDSEPLTSDHYWVITDQWKQEWERGVQVPVKPDSLPGPVVTLTNSNVNNSRRMHHEFKLPKKKYIRITKTEHFSVDEHYLSNVSIQADKCCAYDLEDVDVVWLNILNGERALMGLPAINQDQLERVIEELEMRCWEKVHAIVKKEEGLALEFDESVICDVCRSPDSEDGNEMVFCDCCNICVHQACYGITSIPSGQWLCRTCNLGLRPECVLCPNKNGAMKSTRSGQKWAHVSCALWIPEVSIGCVEKMEPITKISSIPQSRWALICVLCRERVGACIQCSVKTCKTAYHVTCAFKHGLEMRAIIDEENTTDDDNTVKLRSYCQKHSITSKNKHCSIEGGSDEEVKKKQRKDMTTEEKSHARAVKLQEIEAEFEKHVSIKDITRKYEVDQEGLEYIYNYWVLKRRAAFNKPLLSARSEDASDLSNKNQEQVDQEKMRMFVQLRQDLERVRNLCYMVTKREKLFREYIRTRHGTFTKQTELLSDPMINLSTAEITSIKEANHGPSIYDRLYSHPNAPDLTTDFDTMVRRIAGRSDSELSPGLSFNGYVSGKNGKRSCFNGDICKNTGFYDSLSSSTTSDTDSKSCVGVDSVLDTRFKVNNRMNKSQRKNNFENRIKNTARRRKKTSAAMYLDSTTSTEADDDAEDNKSSSSRLSQRSKKSMTNSKKQSSAGSRSFELLESRILGSRSCSVTAAEEDDTEEELFLLRGKTKGNIKKTIVSEIYSSDTDSSCSTKTSDKDRAGSTSKPIRTKASVKEFSAFGSAHRSSKERAGSNGLNKSVTFSSPSKTPSASAPTTDKRKRVSKLFDEESDDTTNQEERKTDKEDKLSTSESEIFVPQKKTTKVANESRNKNRPKGESLLVKSESDKKSSIETILRKAVKKDSSNMDADLLSNDDKSSTNGANYDMLTLVPQRAAAKKAIKAIEHIKNGMVKPPTVFEDPESDSFRTAKTSKLSKKDHHTSSAKQKTTPEELKLENKVVTSEKRNLGQKSSVLTPVSSADSGNSSAIQISVACSTSFPTTSLTTTISSTSNVSISHYSSSTTSSDVIPAVKETAKKPSMSLSGSSTGSSSGGSSSSSSASSGSSSGDSSSSSSSSSSTSSSSSSDSEGEDVPSRVQKNLPGDKSVPTIAAASISVNTAINKRIPESKERISETTINISNKLVTNDNEYREDNKPLLISHDIVTVEQNSRTSSPQQENRSENYLIPDNSSCIETKAAVEHLTSNEQNFLLSPRWESTTTMATTTSIDKDEIKIESNDDEGKKEQDVPPLLSSLPSRSLFSPQLIKDIDLSTFDDVENDINENNNLSDSIASFAFSFGPDLFKEETKEDSSRETYNLVEKLKLEMARKKNNHNGENIDCMTSAPTPDVVINHVVDEDEEKESNSEKLDVNDSKLNESMSSLSDNSQPLVNTSSESNLMLPADVPSPYTDKNVTDSAVLKSPSVSDLFTSCSFPADVLQPDTNSIMLEKESVPISENCGDTSWVQSNRRYDEPDVSSPYHQELQNTADRWADSVMMPSRRSDCSSVSISSQSSSSSMYSEHHQQTSHNDEVPRTDYVPTIDMSQHMQKTVADSLRPPTTLPSDNPFATGNIHDNMYSYQDHLPFVKTSFSPTTPISDKSLYSHSPQQATQPSSLFSTSMTFDSVSTFNNSTFPPLSIQTPCAATASFTTTSQNMAIITSIISPVPPPPPSEEAITATPASASSVNVDEKFVDMISEPPTATVTAAAAVVSELTNETLNNTATVEKIVDTCAPVEDDSYSADTEKENQFSNVVDVINETSSNVIRPLIDKNEIDKKIDLPKSMEPITVTTTSSESSAMTNNQSQSTPKTQSSTNSNSKKSPVKPTRMSARVISQNKSPAAKSPIAPGVSPARLDITVSKGKSRDPTSAARKSHRTNSKGTGTRRGGRGRGRGRSNCFYRNRDDETITNKLVGTVYDFDDEDDLTGDNFENLRAMRERRKSTDTAYCDRLSTSSKDTCYSPKFASPSSQPPSQQSKRKGSVATTPDRRTSHRTQLSPLCEISNNSRVLSKNLYRDAVIPPEEDDDEEEEEDEQGEEEDDDEEENLLSEKKSTSVSGSSGKNEKNLVSNLLSTSSPTLPQPPVQSSAVEQFAAVQPLLPGPVDMRTYNGDNSYESETHVSTYSVSTNHNDGAILPSTFSPTNSSNTEPLPDIVDALEMEIQRYSTLPTTGHSCSKSFPAVTTSPRVFAESSSPSKLVAHNQPTVTSPSHFLVNEQVENTHTESSVTLLDDDNSGNRNQLRMKIKGPYSDANYVPVPATASTAPTQQLPSASNSGSMIPSDGCYTLSSGALNTSVSSAASSSNLRRMRKKELLRQYWAQDENTDQCGNDIAAAVNQTSGMPGDSCFGLTSNTPAKVGPSYKLPKAVASMTTIPTKEDYKEVLGAVAYVEKKKRGKDKTTVVLDAADISNNNANAANSNYSNNNNNNNNMTNNNKHSAAAAPKSPDRKSSAFVNSSNNADDIQDSVPITDDHAPKRKSRMSSSSTSTHPKLKIKIGGVVLADSSSSSVVEEKNLRLRPPKKRLCDQTDVQPQPVVYEQLKKMNMKFRSKVASEFNENGNRYDGAMDDEYSDNDRIDKNTSKEERSRRKRKKSLANSTSGQKSSKRKKKQQRSPSRSGDRNKDAAKDKIHVISRSVDSGDGGPKKIVIKFRGLNSPAPVCESSPPPPPAPAKPPKSSKRNRNHELDSVRTDKITPIRLKLSRSNKGYVSKSSCVDEDLSLATSEASSSMLPKNNVVPNVVVVAATAASSHPETATISVGETTSTVESAPAVSTSETS